MPHPLVSKLHPYRIALCLAFVIAFAVLATAFAQDNASSADASGDSPSDHARIATLSVADLREYGSQTVAVQRVIADALKLTKLNLPYRYGSADPANGAMDCSGTMYYLLREEGLKDVPRDSSEIYRWAWMESHLYPVVSSNPETFELARLKPGDLLFWSGTYRVDRDPPITHVMIYLGINRNTGQRVMMGASEGRRFNDVSRYGVSVFDFVLPRPDHGGSDEHGSDLQARFVGYAPIPGLE